MTEAERFKTAADDLCTVTDAMEQTDLNVLCDEDARRLLDLKQELHEMAGRYRRDQRGSERDCARDAGGVDR